MVALKKCAIMAFFGWLVLALKYGLNSRVGCFRDSFLPGYLLPSRETCFSILNT